MVADLAIALLAAGAGFLGMLFLLLLWFGERTTSSFDLSPDVLDPILGARDRVAIYDVGGPFIPMPGHLNTRDEMVRWMAEDLPKLTAELPKPPV